MFLFLIESLFVEIFVPNSKNIVSWYSLSITKPKFIFIFNLEKFNEILSRISKNNKHCYIMRDYNIDMYCLNEHSETNEFVENLFSHMYLPLISMPTRITAHSATPIDNIFTNIWHKIYSVELLLMTCQIIYRSLFMSLQKLFPYVKVLKRPFLGTLAIAILPNFVHMLY